MSLRDRKYTRLRTEQLLWAHLVPRWLGLENNDVHKVSSLSMLVERFTIHTSVVGAPLARTLRAPLARTFATLLGLGTYGQVLLAPAARRG